MVTNQQLYLMVGIPMLFNAALCGLVLAYLKAKFDAVDRRFDRIDRRFDGIERCLDGMRE